MKEIKVVIIEDNYGKVNEMLEILKKELSIQVLEVDEKSLSTVINLKNNVLNNDVKEKIVHKLNIIGMPKNKVGYKYIVSAMLYLYKEKNIENINMKDIYVELYSTYNKSICSIEKAIRKLIEFTFSYGNLEELYKIFDDTISKDTGKLSNKKFIYEFIKHIM